MWSQPRLGQHFEFHFGHAGAVETDLARGGGAQVDDAAAPAAQKAPAPEKAGPAKAPKKRRLSKEGRAKLAALMKARWAAKKKAAAKP